MAAILEKSGQHEAMAILNVFGAIFMFTGLYHLAKTLKGDNVISNNLAAIGGLLLILCLPVFVTLMGSDVFAIELAKDHGNDVGAIVLAASAMLQMCGMLMVIGLFLVGASLLVQRDVSRKLCSKGITGALFMIVTVLAFIDAVSNEGAGEAVSIIGWMGMFLMVLVTGILTIVDSLKKENQS
jgi:hypothetical protein